MWSTYNAITTLLILLNVNNPYMAGGQVDFNSSTYDFVIVGAGSSGSVLARRLSETWSVLLLEAGFFNPEMQKNIQVPALFWTLQGSPVDWSYITTEQRNACRRTRGQCQYPQGKTLGGSSSINAMLYVRGYKYDYDRWSESGAEGWSHKEVSKYFDRVESKISVSPFKYSTPLAKEYIRAGVEAGLQNTQCNETYNNCIYKTQNTVKDIFRHSAYNAYLENYDSGKLTMIDNAFVTKLIIKSKVTEGVKFEKDGEMFIVRPLKEVILSAGAINSPRILMSSGIGPKEHLEEHNISTIIDLPVGENLHDHTRVAIFYTINSTYPTTAQDLESNKTQQLYADHSGPLSSTGIEAMGFYKTDPSSLEPPDIQLTFSSFVPMPQPSRTIAVTVTVARPESTGSVKLKDANPYSDPVIDPNFFSQENDFKKTILGLEKAHEIINATFFTKYSPTFFPRAFCTGLEADLQEYMTCLAKYHSLTNYHPTGTVKMGNPTDRNSVVDSNLRVIGIDRLRVVDASIAPTLPSNNINSMALMIGEKAADIIRNYYYDDDINEWRQFCLLKKNIFYPIN